MAELREQEGVSFLYITHDVASARYLADRVLVMYAGHLVEEGSTGSVPDRMPTCAPGTSSTVRPRQSAT